jgi:hypothetical protein
LFQQIGKTRSQGFQPRHSQAPPQRRRRVSARFEQGEAARLGRYRILITAAAPSATGSCRAIDSGLAAEFRFAEGRK